MKESDERGENDENRVAPERSPQEVESRHAPSDGLGVNVRGHAASCRLSSAGLASSAGPPGEASTTVKGETIEARSDRPRGLKGGLPRRRGPQIASAAARRVNERPARAPPIGEV